MTIEIGQFAALFVLVAAILKLIDWLMLDDQKRKLGEELSLRLDDPQFSFTFMAKTPILALSRIMASALVTPKTRTISLKRVSAVSSLLILACLVTAGALTDTVFGFNKGPSDAYRKEIEALEMYVSGIGRDEKELTDEEQRVMDQEKQDMSRILETAKHPFARWASLIVIAALIIFTSLAFTNLSIIFTTNTTRAIVTTESPILVAGAVLLNGVGSFMIFLVELVLLFTASSFILIFAFSLLGILFKLGPMWGFAVFSGYGVLAWISAPIWLKALATASLVPFLLMSATIVLTTLVFPFRKPLLSFASLLLRRATTHGDGVVAFLATSFFCLAAAITAATNIINR